jgi:hypothetical protein
MVLPTEHGDSGNVQYSMLPMPGIQDSLLEAAVSISHTELQAMTQNPVLGRAKAPCVPCLKSRLIMQVLGVPFHLMLPQIIRPDAKLRSVRAV